MSSMPSLGGPANKYQISDCMSALGVLAIQLRRKSESFLGKLGTPKWLGSSHLRILVVSGVQHVRPIPLVFIDKNVEGKGRSRTKRRTEHNSYMCSHWNKSMVAWPVSLNHTLCMIADHALRSPNGLWISGLKTYKLTLEVVQYQEKSHWRLSCKSFGIPSFPL